MSPVTRERRGRADVDEMPIALPLCLCALGCETETSDSGECVRRACSPVLARGERRLRKLS